MLNVITSNSQCRQCSVWTEDFLLLSETSIAFRLECDNAADIADMTRLAVNVMEVPHHVNKKVTSGSLFVINSNKGFTGSILKRKKNYSL